MKAAMQAKKIEQFLRSRCRWWWRWSDHLNMQWWGGWWEWECKLIFQVLKALQGENLLFSWRLSIYKLLILLIFLLDTPLYQSHEISYYSVSNIHYFVYLFIQNHIKCTQIFYVCKQSRFLDFSFKKQHIDLYSSLSLNYSCLVQVVFFG